jgi:hypothetical protein
MVLKFRAIRYLIHKEDKILLIGQEVHLLVSIKQHHRCREWEEWAELNHLDKVQLPEVCLQDYQLDFLLIFNKWHRVWILLCCKI